MSFHAFNIHTPPEIQSEALTRVQKSQALQPNLVPLKAVADYAHQTSCPKLLEDSTGIYACLVPRFKKGIERSRVSVPPCLISWLTPEA